MIHDGIVTGEVGPKLSTIANDDDEDADVEAAAAEDGLAKAMAKALANAQPPTAETDSHAATESMENSVPPKGAPTSPSRVHHCCVLPPLAEHCPQAAPQSHSHVPAPPTAAVGVCHK